ncbi:alpha/beta fold hydrolase [soil metagenome]
MRRAFLPLLSAMVLGLSGCGGGDASSEFGDTPPSEARGTLVSSTLLKHYGTAEMNLLFDYEGIDLDAEIDVSLYNVTYWTVDAAGNPYLASGAVAIPDSTTNAGLISYQHSTATQKTNVPGSNNDEALLILAVFASNGHYIVSMPDYVGLGSGAGLHPFLHAATEATASIDAMRAARQLAPKKGVTLNSGLFLCGYSQGGHSTMALAKAIQENYASEFQPTAIAPMSGPYAPAEVELPFALNTPSADSSTFMAYITLAYQSVYGNVYSNLSDVFQSPYDTQVTALFNGQNDLSDIAGQLPADPKNLFTASYVDDILNDASSPMRLALAQNELWNWTPTTQMRLYAAESDEVVSYQNTVNAYNYMSGQGAPVTLVDLGTGLTHVNAIFKATPLALVWFDQISGYSTPTLASRHPR